MLGALEGGWVAPEAGGDLLRDGPGVLPTGMSGCNVHIVLLYCQWVCRGVLPAVHRVC
jgi:hypothetical protein